MGIVRRRGCRECAQRFDSFHVNPALTRKNIMSDMIIEADKRIAFLREYIMSKNTSNGMITIDRPTKEALVCLTSLNQEIVFIQAMSMQMLPPEGVS